MTEGFIEACEKLLPDLSPHPARTMVRSLIEEVRLLQSQLEGESKARELMNYQAERGAELLHEVKQEIRRLKAGEFTEEEFQNLCHKFQDGDARRFAFGCLAHNQKLFGQRSALPSPQVYFKAMGFSDFEIDKILTSGEKQG